MRRTYSGSKTAFMGLMAESGSFNCSSSVRLQHLGVDARLRRRCLRKCPSRRRPGRSSPASGTKSLIIGRAAVGALSQADGGQLGERADRQSEAALDGFHAGDEGGGNRAHAGNQDAELAFGGRNLDVIFCGQFESYSLRWVLRRRG